mmetsp:Transcript_21130/g.58226  ORF Transcript_21130/g.58226 Transcript_21130/m.58226 type:complete len:132 (+) Transcript_21130:315-710(+)
MIVGSIAFWEDFFPRQKKKVGKMAPNLGRIEYVEGERLTIPTDKVTVVNFFLPHEKACQPCLPVLAQLASRWKEEGVAQVLGISVQHKVTTEPWLKEEVSAEARPTYPIACDFNMVPAPPPPSPFSPLPDG